MIKKDQTAFLSIMIAAATLLLSQCAFMYGDTGRDDAFFTYWAAKALADHGSILNYNGESVEQSSTLLYTLLLAGLHKLTPFLAIPTLSVLLSLTAGWLTLLAAALILRDSKANPASALILAVSPSLVFWSCSGMETSLSTALFTGILLLCLIDKPSKNQLLQLALLTVMAVLTRPETFLVFTSFTLAAWSLTTLLNWVAGNKNIHSKWIVMLGTTMFTAAAVSLWRYVYFDAWLPQPVAAKSSHDYLNNIFHGINYLLDAGQSSTTRYILAAGLASVLTALFYWKHPQRMAILIAGLLAIAQLAFIIATGGDWMDATRFLLPVLPALLICLFLFLSPWKHISTLMFIGLFFLAANDSWQFSQEKSTGLNRLEQTTIQQRYLSGHLPITDYSAAELHTKDALRDIPQLEHLKTQIAQLQKHPEKINIASIQMGFIPYHLADQFFRKVKFLDMRALSTQEFSSCHILDLFPRTEYGIKISYDEFFGLLPNLERQCGIQKPDILYDLGYDMRRQILEDNGYVITYLEKRHISGDFSKRWIGSELFVAVRKELAAQYKLKDIHGNVPTIPQKEPQKLPNIVLLIADDISFDHFGFMGNAAARTPTLDQMAQQGTVFTNGYVPTAFCRPSLATLLTGSWPHQNNLYANHGVTSLQPGYNTLATLLQKQGYRTFAGGKFWEDEPQWRGFDQYDVSKNTFAREQQDKLWQFIDNHAGEQPLFIWWAPMLPHTPHNPPRHFLDAIDKQAIAIPDAIPEERRQEYLNHTQNLLAMNLWLDDEIRKLHDKLAEKNQIDNTLFVFLTDNGFSHRSPSKNTPYELGLRTPIIFSWPATIPHQSIDAPVNSINLYNTLLDYAGVSQLPRSRLQPGHTLRPVVEKKTLPVPEKIFGADYPSYNLKIDPSPRPERDIFALHLRDGDWKYIFYLRDLREEDNRDLTIQSGMMPFPARHAGDEELYYLPTDAFEEKNLAAQADQQQRIKQFRRDVIQWWYSSGGKKLTSTDNCPAQPTALCQKLAAIPDTLDN